MGTRRGGSNEYTHSMFWSKNKKKKVYPCIPQFCYIKDGFKRVSFPRTCFPDAIIYKLHTKTKSGRSLINCMHTPSLDKDISSDLSTITNHSPLSMVMVCNDKLRSISWASDWKIYSSTKV